MGDTTPLHHNFISFARTLIFSTNRICFTKYRSVFFFFFSKRSHQRGVTQERDHTSEGSHQRGVTQERGHTREGSHKRGVTSERGHTRELPHKRGIIPVRGHTREGSHQWGVTPERSHTERGVTQRGLHWRAITYLGDFERVAPGGYKIHLLPQISRTNLLPWLVAVSVHFQPMPKFDVLTVLWLKQAVLVVVKGITSIGSIKTSFVPMILSTSEALIVSSMAPFLLFSSK